MTERAVKRPPILAGACLYLGALAAVISIRAVTVVSSWNSESRAADFSPALRALRDAGLGQESAETSYKVFLSVIAVLAACGAVFAFYTSRGHRASRIGMTVAIGVSGTATFLGGLGGTLLFAMIGALAVAFTIRLWTGEIRTYFRTLAGHEPPAPKVEVEVAAPVDPFTTMAKHPTPPSVEQPDPQSYAQAPAQPYAQAQAHGYPPPPGYQQQAWPPGRPGKEPLPKPVSIVIWSTFIGSIVAAGLSGLMLLAVLLGGVDYEAVIEQGGPGADMIRGSEGDFDTAMRFLTAISAVAVVLGIGGLLASIRALTKRRSGGVPLFVLAVSTVVVSVIGFPLGLPWTVLAIVVLVQLRRPEARAWFSRT